MKRWRLSTLAVVLLAVPFLFAGCGGDDGGTTEPTNHDPVITSVTVSPNSVTAGGTATVTVTATDQDNDALTYTYVPNGGSITGAGMTVTWNAPTTAGPYSITVTVTDGNGGSATSTGSLAVTAAQTGITGTAQAVAGVQVDLRNSRVAIYDDYNDWVMDQYVMTSTATGTEFSVTFSFTNVAPGTYYLDLWKDMNNNGLYDAGDLFGFYGQGAWPNSINFNPITVLQSQIANIGNIFVVQL
ncbi:MAG: Ig-like domain-containing protein [Candidatus Eisenbacteria bacterium]